MRDRLRPEWIGAIAGLALIVIVFLPWYDLDPASAQGPGSSSKEVLGYLSTYSAGETSTSAWDAIPRAALVWIAVGLLGLAGAGAARLGLGTQPRRWLAAATAGLGTIGLIVAVGRLADPPYESYSSGALAYAGTALMAIVAASAVLGLRRT